MRTIFDIDSAYNLKLLLRYYKHSLFTNFKLFLGKKCYKWEIFSEKSLNKIADTRVVCHVLGSGYSLTDSLSLINSDSDFVIGFNFSGLEYKYSDLYFIEIADLSGKVSKAQYELWRYLNSLDVETNFIFKNIGEKRINLSAVNRYYKNRVLYLKDAVIGIDDKRSIDLFLDLALKNSLFIRNHVQTISSTIIAISLAYKIGFRKIILHGVDFCGPHFYDLVTYKNHQLEDIRKMVASGLKVNHTTQHRTNAGIITHQDLLLKFKNKLMSLGVVLDAALIDSNLGKLFASNSVAFP